METYLTLLYVTLEQELALKEYFLSKGWTYSKPDLNVMTDKVGPFNNPQAVRTKSGKIITYNDVSVNDANDRPTKACSKIMTENRKGRKCAVPAAVSDTIKVEVSSERREFPGQLDGYEGDEAEESLENDDGDNDDDYADDLNNKIREGEENISGDNLSPKRHGRPVRQSQKVKGSNLGSPADTDPAEQEMTPTGRKRRRVAAKAVETIQNVMSEEKEKTQSKNSTSFVDKHHLRQLLTEALRSSKSGKESSKTDFAECPHCQKRIRNTNLRRHMLMHLGLPFRCTRCSSYYKSQDELEKHRLEKHVGEFICKYCGLKYRFKNSLTEHIQTRHEGTAKMYECSVCGVKMCRKSHMDDHMNIHNNVNPYNCQNCSKSYKNKSAFKRHMKDCGSGIKHVCNACGQIYKSSVGLQDHIRRCHDETNSYMFSCVCKASFKTRSARCRHRIHCESYKSEKNGTQSPDVVQQNITILRVTSSSNELNFYGDSNELSKTNRQISNQSNTEQNVNYEFDEMSSGEANDTDPLEQGQTVTFDEPTSTFE
ncbi:zinc finger protein 2-like isoform X1 [Ruditapes philippinarum]|uniref:zinc finger protein 2-like isoform X1 n=1 Tax=Ruditapes philippinarum TaxID=129788 RepID=UPI00295B3DD1|nr:zinc finger protein 2-like isoform X1 [Ruditapes philippinarum]